MANAESALDMENIQPLQQAIHNTFGGQNSSEAAKSHNLMKTKFIIPQLLPKTNAGKPSSAAQDEHKRAAAACNQQLLNRIKMRQIDGNHASTDLSNQAFTSQLTIPKLRAPCGKSLDELKLNIPLLNQLKRQNNFLEVTQLEVGVNKLKINTDDGGDSAKPKNIQETQEGEPPLIDLTSTLIDRQKNAPLREAASKMRHRQSAVVDHFDIPFIECDTYPSVGMLFKKSPTCTAAKSVIEKVSPVGAALDAAVGYPAPRKPHPKYVASSTELRNLKIYKRDDYVTNIKRFMFDTPSPDEIVKEALQKSRRISRT